MGKIIEASCLAVCLISHGDCPNCYRPYDSTYIQGLRVNGMSDYVQLAQKVVDAYNDKDVDAFIGMYAEGADVVFPDLTAPNREEMIAEFHEIIEAFPDRLFDVSRIVATEKGAMVECITRGTNTGPLFGMPPTNKELALPMIHVYDFENGKVVRHRCYANFQIMMQQLTGE